MRICWYCFVQPVAQDIDDGVQCRHLVARWRAQLLLRPRSPDLLPVQSPDATSPIDHSTENNVSAIYFCLVQFYNAFLAGNCYS